MTDHMAADLAAANDEIDRLERRWAALADAERHPRWTTGGELVLLGDLGIDADGTPFTVIAVDLFGRVTTLDVYDAVGVTNPTVCHALVRRQPIPPPQMEAIEQAWQDEFTKAAGS